MGQKTRWDSGNHSLTKGVQHFLRVDITRSWWVKNKQFVRYIKSNLAINDTYRNNRRNNIKIPWRSQYHYKIECSFEEFPSCRTKRWIIGDRYHWFNFPNVRCGLVLFRHSTLLFNCCLYSPFQQKFAEFWTIVSDILWALTFDKFDVFGLLSDHLVKLTHIRLRSMYLLSIRETRHLPFLCHLTVRIQKYNLRLRWLALSSCLRDCWRSSSETVIIKIM